MVENRWQFSVRYEKVFLGTFVFLCSDDLQKQVLRRPPQENCRLKALADDKKLEIVLICPILPKLGDFLAGNSLICVACRISKFGMYFIICQLADHRYPTSHDWLICITFVTIPMVLTRTPAQTLPLIWKRQWPSYHELIFAISLTSLTRLI